MSAIAKPTTVRRRGRPARIENSVAASSEILDAAEQLFAERGFHGVTTREIAFLAKVDDALIFYHFKNKQGLFDAVVARRIQVMLETRRTSLSDYVAKAGDRVTVEGALEAVIAPLIDLFERGGPGWKSYFSLLAQIYNIQGGGTVQSPIDQSVRDLIDLIAGLLPSVPKADLFWAYHFMSGSVMIALSENSRIEQLSENACRADDFATIRPRLLRFCTAGFLSAIHRCER